MLATSKTSGLRADISGMFVSKWIYGKVVNFSFSCKKWHTQVDVGEFKLQRFFEEK
jgi:hypothetical protein